MCRGPRLRSEDVQDYTQIFQNKSDEQLLAEIKGTEHVYKRIQLLGILLKRHDETFLISPDMTGKE